MHALEYLMPRPPWELTPGQAKAFGALADSTPPGGLLEYRLEFPKWQFLSYLCQTRELVLHGSQTAGLEEIQPRVARDVRAFSAQEAIYATTDGIWAIFFAIVDRMHKHPLSLFNSCLEIRLTDGDVLGPLYFFSITEAALRQAPWCSGEVYLIPRRDFTQEPAQRVAGVEIEFPHWISTKTVKPAAALQVQPWDFPFLAKIHGHDDEKLDRLTAVNPEGFPWPEALSMEQMEEK
jgi:hypothetical protein